MNPENLVSQVGKLLMNTQHAISNTQHICIWQGKLEIHRTTHTGKKHTVICMVTVQESYDGFTTAKWRRIADRLAAVQKEVKTNGVE